MDSRQTLHLQFHPTSYKTTQSDPTGNVFVPGDEVFLGGTMLASTSPHEQVGTVGLHCQATGAGGSELLCDVVFALKTGKVACQTLFDLQREWLQPTRKLAITGGTGEYRHARGELTVTSMPSGDERMLFEFE